MNENEIDLESAAKDCDFDAIQEAKDNGAEIKGALETIRDNAENDDYNRKRAALCLFLDESPEYVEGEAHDESEFSAPGRATYRVLTDDEATDEANSYIRESVWSFRPEFLAGETGIDADVFRILSDKCEGANKAVLSLIEANGGFESFAKKAIAADGRGHFLAHYDNEQNESGEFFIFRTN